MLLPIQSVSVVYVNKPDSLCSLGKLIAVGIQVLRDSQELRVILYCIYL